MAIDRLVTAAAGVPFGMAIAVVLGLARLPASGRIAPDELAATLAVALEFLLAAGLLRLAAIGDLQLLAAVATIVLLRRVLTIGIRFALGARARARQASAA